MKLITLDRELLHLLVRYLFSSLIMILIKHCFNLQSCLGSCVSDKFKYNLIRSEWFSTPVDGDKRKHCVLNIVPFGCPRRIVADMDDKATRIGKLTGTL